MQSAGKHCTAGQWGKTPCVSLCTNRAGRQRNTWEKNSKLSIILHRYCTYFQPFRSIMKHGQRPVTGSQTLTAARNLRLHLLNGTNCPHTGSAWCKPVPQSQLKSSCLYLPWNTNMQLPITTAHLLRSSLITGHNQTCTRRQRTTGYRQSCLAKKLTFQKLSSNKTGLHS